MRMITGTWIAATLVIASTGCGTDSAQPAMARSGGPLVVAAVNYPLAYMAGRIGGDAVQVVLPVPSEVDPAFWRPAAAAIARFQEADLILLNGAGYAGWTRRATLPNSRLVDTSEAFADQLIERSDLVNHRHGPEGEHAHGTLAFTTWLDPQLAVLHAAAIRDALVKRRPESADSFGAAFAGLETDLRELDERLMAVATRSADRAVIFSHPVYDYLARRYEIEGPSLHWEPNEAPTADQWKELEQLVAECGARWLVWEGEPLPATVEGLSERGLRSVVLDPCCNRPAEGDLLDVMLTNTGVLEQIFGVKD